MAIKRLSNISRIQAGRELVNQGIKEFQNTKTSTAHKSYTLV